MYLKTVGYVFWCSKNFRVYRAYWQFFVNISLDLSKICITIMNLHRLCYVKYEIDTTEIFGPIRFFAFQSFAKDWEAKKPQ